MNRRSILAFLGLAPLAPVAARALPAAAPVIGQGAGTGDRVVQGALSVEGTITARRISRGTVFGEGRIVVEADASGLVSVRVHTDPKGPARVSLRRNGEEVANFHCDFVYDFPGGIRGLPNSFHVTDYAGPGTHTYEAVCTNGTVMLEAVS